MLFGSRLGLGPLRPAGRLGVVLAALLLLAPVVVAHLG
jgi:hypothetical protein